MNGIIREGDLENEREKKKRLNELTDGQYNEWDRKQETGMGNERRKENIFIR